MIKFSAIFAMAQNRTIGCNNLLPWKFPEDLKRFRLLTQGHSVIMGRKTFESIGKVLPNRKNIIMTRQPDYDAPGGIIVSSWEEACQVCSSDASTADTEVFVIGGAEVYRLSFPYIQRIYLTFIHKDFEGDAFFLEDIWENFSEVAREEIYSEKVLLSFFIFDRKVKV